MAAIEFASFRALPGTIELSRTWRRVAVVMPGYRAGSDGIGAGSRLLHFVGRLWTHVTSPNYRAHVQLYRDFYANPRPVEYMIACIGEFVAATCRDAQVDLLTTQDLEAAARNVLWARSLKTAAFVDALGLRETLGTSLDSAQPDVVLLIHPDAIGLGHELIEDAILRSFTGPVLILNGRRRAYELSPSRRKRLRWHRFLAETRIIEVALARQLQILAMFYATMDRIVGTRRS